jgi:F0F1-type ATP synthase assembly protein I
MKLFDAIIFGAFVGFLVDYWLARAARPDPLRLIVAIVVGAIAGVLVFAADWAVF